MALDNRDALIAHIAHLDSIIRMRNSQISELQKQLNEKANLPLADLLQLEINKAYIDGFRFAKRQGAAMLNEYRATWSQLPEPKFD